jgi:hypothetical protein
MPYFSVAYRPAVCLILSPVHSVHGLCHRTQISRGVKLTIAFHLVPRLKMHGATPLLLHISSWLGAYLITGTTLPVRTTIWHYTISNRDDYGNIGEY